MHDDVQISKRSFVSMLRSYCNILGALILDASVHFKKQFAGIIFSGIAGTFFQLLGIALIGYYSHALKNNQTVNILGFELMPPSIEIFLLVVVAIFISFFLGALRVYWYNSKIVNIMVDYERICSKNIFRLVAENSGICTRGSIALYDKKDILKAAKADSRLCGRVIGMLVRLFQPSMTFLVLFIALFVIDPLVTVIIMFVIGISFYFQFKNNLLGVSSSKMIENSARGAAKDKEMIFMAATKSQLLEEDFFDWTDRKFANGPIGGFAQAYRNRLLTIENAKFINEIAITVTFLSVLAILGAKGIIYGQNWGIIIVYILALRHCYSYLQTSVVTLTALNRFYPNFSRYIYFVKSFNRKEETDCNPGKVPGITIRQRKSASIRLAAGEILAICGQHDLSFSNISIYIRALFSNRESAVKSFFENCIIINSNANFLPSLSFRTHFGFPERYNVDQLKADLFRIGVENKDLDVIPDDLEEKNLYKKTAEMKSDLKLVIAMLGAIRSANRFICVTDVALDVLPDNWHSGLMKILKKHILLVFYRRSLYEIGKHSEQYVAVVAGENVIALGTLAWLRKNRSEVSEKLKYQLTLSKTNLKKEEVQSDDLNELDEEI